MTSDKPLQALDATTALATPIRQPFVEPQLTEQGDLGEVTAAGFGDMSP